MTSLPRPRRMFLACLLFGSLNPSLPAGAETPEDPAKDYARQAAAWTKDATKQLFDETASESMKASYDFVERQVDLMNSLHQLERAENESTRSLAAAQSGLNLVRVFMGAETPGWVDTARSTLELAKDLQGKTSMDALQSLATSDLANRAFMGAGLSPAIVATQLALVNAYGNFVRAWMDFPEASAPRSPMPRLDLPEGGHIVKIEHEPGRTTVIWERNPGDYQRTQEIWNRFNGQPAQPKPDPSRGGIRVSAQVSNGDFAPRGR